MTIALLTGNIEPGARLKLGAIGLNEAFPFGAFGSDSPRREELPPIAVERAARHSGHTFRGAEVVIIGDSIYDVRCGVPHGATTIAIASGKTPAQTLKAENPSYFFDSAEDVDGIVAAITEE
jgi:phosphoglycolate phosphatase